MASELKYFGFFDELGLETDGVPPKLRDNMGATASPEDGGILQYLAEGWICLETFDEQELDVLATPPVEIGPLRILTDGVWVWPNIVAHYVENHGLHVPEEFVARMRANAWHVPLIPNDEFDAIVEQIVGSAAGDDGLDEILKMIEDEGGRS